MTHNKKHPSEAIFRECARAIHATESKSFTEAQRRHLEVGLNSLLEIVEEIATARRKNGHSKYVAFVKNALSDLHIATAYSADTLVLRDVCDVALTIEFLARGDKRKRGDKSAEAHLFCSCMADEFKGWSR